MLTVILVLATVGVIWSGLRGPGGYLTGPVLWGTTIFAFVLPQWAALNHAGFIPGSYLERLWLMVLLCLLATVLGWHLGASQTKQRRLHFPPVSIERLLLPAALLTTLMFVVNIYQLRLGAQLQEQGITQWTGPATILAFLSSLRPVSLTLSLMLLLTRRSAVTATLVLANLAIVAVAAFVLLRRTEMIELGISVLAALWFARRIRVSAMLLVGAVFMMSIVTFSIGQLRQASLEVQRATGAAPSLFSSELWRSVDLKHVQESIELAPDLANASYLIGEPSHLYHYGLGSVFWDGFVHQWVPAQILGKDAKDSFLIGTSVEDQFLQISHADQGFRFKGGTTATGFATAYLDFGFLGFAVFIVIGAILGMTWVKAEGGDVWSQAFYPALAATTLVCFTHEYYLLFSAMPLYAICKLILKSLAGKPKRTMRSQTRLSSKQSTRLRLDQTSHYGINDLPLSEK